MLLLTQFTITMQFDHEQNVLLLIKFQRNSISRVSRKSEIDWLQQQGGKITIDSEREREKLSIYKFQIQGEPRAG